MAVFAHHHDAFGGVVQHRGIEGPGLVQLLGQLQQFTAVAFELQQGVDLVPQHAGVEGFEHEVHCAGGVALEHRILGLGDGGDEDNRHKAGARVATHQPGDFETIHMRHLHVQQDQADILFQQATQGRLTRFHTTKLPVAILEQGLHGLKVFRSIIHHQQNLGLAGRMGLDLPHSTLLFPGCSPILLWAAGTAPTVQSATKLKHQVRSLSTYLPWPNVDLCSQRRNIASSCSLATGLAR